MMVDYTWNSHNLAIKKELLKHLVSRLLDPQEEVRQELTKTEKVLGAQMNCPSCKQVLVCRNKHYDAYGDKPARDVLQWQDQDKEEAHYNWDSSANKAVCKKSVQNVNTQLAQGQQTLSGVADVAILSEISTTLKQILAEVQTQNQRVGIPAPVPQPGGNVV